MTSAWIKRLHRKEKNMTSREGLKDLISFLIIDVWQDTSGNQLDTDAMAEFIIQSLGLTPLTSSSGSRMCWTTRWVDAPESLE